VAVDEQTPLRTCPSCGAERRTRFERCPECSASYFATPRAVVRRRLLLAGGLGGVALVALVVLGIALLGDRSGRERRERAQTNAAVAALRARLRRIQAPHRGAAVALRPAPGASPATLLHARRGLVLAAEASITADARARAAAGELDGPILRTACGPILRSKDAIPDDRVLSKPIGRYDCIAVKSDVKGRGGRQVASLGHPFVAALDFRRFRYVWCRNTPAQSERGVALVFVRLERACLAARGRAMGTGYADVPDT
jgi:hypothetical protein